MNDDDTADNLHRALMQLVSVIEDIIPNLNEGDFEKELLQNRLDGVYRELDQ